MARTEAPRNKDARLERYLTIGIIGGVAGLIGFSIVHPPDHTPTLNDVYGPYNPDVSPGQADQAHVDWLLSTQKPPSGAPPAPVHTPGATNGGPSGDHSHFNDNTGNALTDAGEVFKDKYGWWYYNQRFDAWYHTPLGNSSDIPIGQEGCLLADFAMIQSHLTGQKVTPLELNQQHKDWFTSLDSPSHGAGIKVPFPELAGHKPLALHVPPGNFDALHQKVRDGYALILELSYKTNDGVTAYHYVVARGLDANGHLLINDPWYGDNDNVPYGLNWSNFNFDGAAWAYK